MQFWEIYLELELAISMDN